MEFWQAPWAPDLDDGKRWYSGGRFSVRAIAIKGGGSGRREAKYLPPSVTLGVGLEYLRFFQDLQKCGRRYTLDTFRGNERPKRRFLGGPKGSKSMAGATL